jgi:CheY-like chemotaxis protein
MSRSPRELLAVATADNLAALITGSSGLVPRGCADLPCQGAFDPPGSSGAYDGRSDDRGGSTVAVPTVLVVDDDDDIRELTQLALEAVAGWTVLTADCGAAAIQAAREHLPDAVLLDMMMPDMDGLTAFGHLQAHETTQTIPVILFTAKAQVPGERPPWAGHAIRGVIAKPYDAMTIADQVTEILGWPASSSLG